MIAYFLNVIFYVFKVFCLFCTTIHTNEPTDAVEQQNLQCSSMAVFQVKGTIEPADFGELEQEKQLTEVVELNQTAEN